MNWGESFFDHYERLFRKPKTAAMFQSHPGAPRIQVLGFHCVYGGGARVFCTLGLTHYSEAVGAPVELMLAVDEAFEDAQKALANACFHAATHRIRIGVGSAIGGLQNVTPHLAARWGKSALYVTAPYNLPDGAKDVPCGAEAGTLLMAVLISPAEHQFLQANGPAAFEAMLERAEVDPIHLARPSACSYES